MSAIGRRQLLGGLAAAALVTPRVRAASPDVLLQQALDGLADVPLAERPAALAGFDPRTLSRAARIDLLTVRRGVEIDVALARLVPGKPDSLPYRASLQRPVGEEAYRLLLERLLGAPLSPEAAHRRLEREIARLSARADVLFSTLGHASGSAGERFTTLFADPRWHYPDSDAGRDRAVADMNRGLDSARAIVPALVGAVPPWCLDASVRRMSREEEAAGKAGYRQLPDPGRLGIYFVDLREIGRRPSWSLKSVVHHELLPGHMIQLPIEAEAHPHPLRLAYLPAFAEGWAIRAEEMMAARGAYRGDTAGELGHIHWLLFRAARALADTGIHHRGWDLAEARRRVMQIQGVPAYFAAFDADLQRIQAEPGVRAAEAWAWLALRDAGTSSPWTCRQVLRWGRLPLRMIARRRD